MRGGRVEGTAESTPHAARDPWLRTLILEQTRCVWHSTWYLIALVDLDVIAQLSTGGVGMRLGE